MGRTDKRRALSFILAATLPAVAGCELLVEALKDGVADFLESTTADVLEEAFAAPKAAVSEITK